MTPEYAQIARALARCGVSFLPSSKDRRIILEIDAMRYNEQEKPLTRKQEGSLRTLAQKYRWQLPDEIVALAAKLEPKG
jgi:hypothetical protein